MFGRIAAFEFRYQLRQPVFYVVSLVFFLLSFGAVASENVTFGLGPNVHKNAPGAIALMTLVFSMFYMLVTTAFVANVIIRDDSTGFGPIVRSTPIRKFDYLFGRFTGAFAAVLISFLAVPLGIMVGTLAPWVDRETLGPFRFGDYAYNYLVFAVPSLLLTSALFFALATVTRSMMATYLGVVAVFVGYLIGSSFLERPELQDIGALLDPFGSIAYGKVTEYWTPAESNVRNALIEGVLLTNRALALGLSLAALALAYVLFRFEARGRAARKKEKLAKLETTETPPVRTGPLPAPRFGAATSWAVLVKRTRFEMAQIFKSPALPVLLLLGVFQVGLILWFSIENDQTALYPVTRSMISGAHDGMGLVLIIVASYYAGELVWRERERRVHEITDSSAVPDWAFVLPKTLGITLVLGSLVLAAALTGVALQTLKGYYNYELDKYLVWYLLPEFVAGALLAVFAIFVQVLSPNKFVGWGVMMLYLIASLVLSNLGFDHPLYRYGAGVGVPLSDMNGQGDYRGFATWFDLYWSAFAVVMLVLAYLMWRRGTESRYAARLKRLPRRLVGVPGAIAGVSLAAFVGLGVYIFINTTVWNEYRSRQGWERYQADYEKALLPYENTPQPSLTEVRLAIDLYPHAPRAVVRGSYVLENLTGAPLREVHLRTQERDLKIPMLEVEGARRTRVFDEYNYWIYSFKRPMAPGERRTVRFATELAQRGFKAGGNTTRLVDNGTFINHAEFAPTVGMDRTGLIQERAKRRKYKLPPELRMKPVSDNPRARQANYIGADWVKADITVSTVADQTPIAPGYKVSDVTQNGRRTARFVTEAPILAFFSVQSARYAVTSERYKGVELAIYHHPTHAWNVQRMIRTLKTGLDYYQAEFGPYQFRQARIIEFPAYASFAQAFANTMPYSESIGFAARYDDEEKIDYVTFVTAHELGHQWWAHQVVGADQQGATLLSETLAEYSALMVMERTNGPHRLRKFLKRELDIYLGGRSQDPLGESPLVRVEAGQTYIHYRKGSMVMYLLRDQIGEAAVNRALRRVLETYRFKSAPYPTSAELIRAIRAETPAAQQTLVTDLFERITLYDAKAKTAKAVKRRDGRWDVTVTVEAKKLYADAEGEETEAPLNERFDVGVFTAEPGKKGFDPGKVVAFERRPIRSGAQAYTFTVDRKPTHAGVDPYNKWIDRDSDDNVIPVTEG